LKGHGHRIIEIRSRILRDWWRKPLEYTRTLPRFTRGFSRIRF